MTRFSPEVEDVLRSAGWSPERRTTTDGWTALFENEGIHAHQAAIDFLQEFGGLNIEIHGSGITRAKEPFELDPSLCESEEGRFTAFGRQIGREIFPIGEIDYGRYLLGIDQNTEVYVVETWIANFGPMPTAMENLVLGVKPTPIE
jgi:hypothetical protein